jgi:hypothetical protein
MTIESGAPQFVTAKGVDIYVEQVERGPDVLLIGGPATRSSRGSSSSTGSPTATD